MPTWELVNTRPMYLISDDMALHDFDDLIQDAQARDMSEEDEEFLILRVITLNPKLYHNPREATSDGTRKQDPNPHLTGA